MKTSDFLDSLNNCGKYDVGRCDSSRPSYVGRYEDGGLYVSADDNQYYSDNDIILKYHPRTEGQRMSTAAHEAGHMLAYMVAIAMETDSHEFAKECSNRINMVCVNKHDYGTDCGGFISCDKEYKLSHTEAYKRMLCGGAIGEWCEELERTENQDINVSLGYFTYAAKGHYNVELMKSLYKSCGGETDSEHLIDLCTLTGTTIQEETLKTLRLFRHKEFIDTWKVLYLKLFNQSKFTNLDVHCFAQEYRDIIYSIREDEEAKEKEREKLEYMRNNSLVKRVWHRICKYVIKDNTNKKDTDA